MKSQNSILATAAIAVIDGDGTNHLVKLRRPLALPAPDQ